MTGRQRGDAQDTAEGKKERRLQKYTIKVYRAPDGGCPGQCRREEVQAAIKVGYKSTPGARGGMPRKVQQGRKGGYKSTL